MEKTILGKEKEFHDKWAAGIDIGKVTVDESFEACTAPENRFILKRLGDLRGRKILDVGCGAGDAAVYFAKRGADVTAIDLSPHMLRVTEQLADRHGVSVKTKESAIGRIGFPDETFDIVYAANVLHHVDIKAALAEIHRVLKKGGIFCSWDPLAHNPIINLYRKLSKDIHTPDEHPIKMKELKYFKNVFSHFEYETTWFLTLWFFIKYYLVDKMNPNKERYWDTILADGKKIEDAYYRLEKIDRFLLKKIPFLRRYCWNVVIIAVR